MNVIRFSEVDDTIQTESAPPTPVKRTNSKNGNNILTSQKSTCTNFIFSPSYHKFFLFQAFMALEHCEDNGAPSTVAFPGKVPSLCRRHPHCLKADIRLKRSSNRRDL